MHHIHFSMAVDQNSAHRLIDTLHATTMTQDLDVTLYINSPGGNVVAGIHAYNMISAMPLNLTTHNVGNVDSIANVIFLAGAKRAASPYSTFMFHSVGFDQSGPIRLEERNLRQFLDSVVADNKRMGGIIASRTDLTERSAGALFREQKTRESAWALKNGFVHDVRDPSIAPGTNVVKIA